ncbi:Uncharacterised protein [Chryseobacterium gleum]|uniref:Uncharacterized protein n=2 Tax=Chryseobacterium gleum TaxID=250 RepID=A0A448B7W0_CHRGE|nr:hypothetical protein [Chryseobacterium gleum]EFK36832.1 hypothetical protein HMPREF0204_11389 [Chryseobacterium gleum ATCC 35910]QQY32085.1 hypothetical protein I6I60_25190 [Chryseobacterium gleum]VEE10694.1 Uncharacterised protein [Chryseobacterium gleum]
MKQLEITTNKRLLIVEFPEMPEVYKYHKEFIFFKFKKENEYNDGAIRVGFEKIKEICKGSDLTEDIAYEIVDGFDLGYFVDYNHHNPRAYKLTALESFISAIQSKNYHWGDNPEPSHYDYSNDDCETDFAQYYLDHEKWKKSESRTFNPSKCIIFEIL